MNIKKITGKSNVNIKHTALLLKSRKARKINREFVIEGIRLCTEAMQNNVNIKQCFFMPEFFETHIDIIKNLSQKCQHLFEVEHQVLAKISDTESPQGIVCVCKMLEERDCQDKISNEGSVLILENIQDPQNLGTILRTARALGVSGVYLSEDCCDVYSPKVLRGSMGAVFCLPFIITATLEASIKWLKSQGFTAYASVPQKGALNIKKIAPQKKIAVAIGNEGNGLTKPLIDACDNLITIPMAKGAESLNAAVAAGIIIWEILGNNTEI